MKRFHLFRVVEFNSGPEEWSVEKTFDDLDDAIEDANGNFDIDGDATFIVDSTIGRVVYAIDLDGKVTH